MTVDMSRLHFSYVGCDGQVRLGFMNNLFVFILILYIITK